MHSLVVTHTCPDLRLGGRVVHLDDPQASRGHFIGSYYPPWRVSVHEAEHRSKVPGAHYGELLEAPPLLKCAIYAMNFCWCKSSEHKTTLSGTGASLNGIF